MKALEELILLVLYLVFTEARVKSYRTGQITLQCMVVSRFVDKSASVQEELITQANETVVLGTGRPLPRPARIPQRISQRISQRILLPASLVEVRGVKPRYLWVRASARARLTTSCDALTM